jgi:hypothetical protein
MVFPILAPPDPQGPWYVNNFEFTLESFFVNLSSSGSVVLEKISKWSHLIFAIISHLKRTWPFIWFLLNSLYPRMICTKFHWNWSAGSGEKDFIIIFFLQCTFALLLLSHPGQGCYPSFEQFWTSPTPRWFVPSLVKIGRVVLEKKSKMFTYRRTTADQRKAHLSWIELSSQVSIRLIREKLTWAELSF